MDEALIASLLAALPLPTLLIGADERIIGANAKAEHLMGQPLEGRHFITVLRQPPLLDTIEACLRENTPRETRYLSNDGPRDTSFVVSCAPVDMGPDRGVMVSFEDMTHLEEAGQMRRDFVANVSHELRTPLTSLLGFIETLQGPARDDPAAAQRFLGIMQGEAARMERLVRDLLSLSRVEAEERVRPNALVDLVATLRAVSHALRPLAAEAGVDIALDLPETPVHVPADADQLAQVVSNLVENAVKYGGAGKRVELGLAIHDEDPHLRGPAAVITVRDHGAGFDPVHVPRLTERFYRIDNHRSRQMGGTGLGLAIVKHIVNRHRGRLRISSTPGQGSEFRVILPQERPS
ncbi:two-component sensor histidine kinase [Roseovarius faecimaris]|uniref:histidine kinase n=1 Tax=Roseovarius faecimaris TaxID=2494550 RepID=A0A6I6IR89_9RHOB|nr:ATP-binding protein [Roseovarius faecimaris]QGX98401.1 two-component sensor histidine kinase [Roseovarius faecimaris]